MLKSILPRRDPARTITASALLCFSVIATYKLATFSYKCVRSLIRQRAKSIRSAEQKEGIVYLYVFPKKPNNNSSKESSSSSSSVKKVSKMFSLSAPCMAVELFLRLNKIPFEEVVIMDAADVSPTERLPCVEYNGKTYTDAKFIMEFLEKEILEKRVQAKKEEDNEQGEEETIEKNNEEDEPNQLENEEALLKKQKRKERKQLENKTIETSVLRILESLRLNYGRGVLVDNTKLMIDVISREFSYPKSVVSFIFNYHRKETIEMLNQQGYGDLTQEQFEETFLDDVKTLEYYISNPSKTSSSVTKKKSGEEPPTAAAVENDEKKEEKEDKEGKEKEEKLCQFVCGARSPSKIDCLVAVWLKLLRFYDESIIITSAESSTTSSSSSSSSKKSKKKSSSLSSPTTSVSESPASMTTQPKKVNLLSDSSSAIAFLVKSEVVTEYLKRIDKYLHKAAV